MADIVLTVNGKRYSGWESARVTKSIESISGSFLLSVSERWADQASDWEIDVDDECSVSVAGETVITGYVSARKPSYDSSGHTLEITGRDKTADLVDCSAFVGAHEFNNVDVYKFCKKICAPFGIKVSVQPGLTFQSVGKVSFQVGEKAFHVIEELCRKAAVLPVAGDDGELFLTRAGEGRCSTALVEGQNILSLSAEYSVAERFRKYIVVGQQPATDEEFGASAAGVSGSAEDPNVSRASRLLVVHAEGGVSAGYAKRRAQWEASVRAARSSSVSVTVQGWTQANGELWPVNSLVRVKSPRARINGEMLISQVEYSVDSSGGTTASLSLKPPKAFLPEPQVAKDGLWKEISRGVVGPGGLR